MAYQRSIIAAPVCFTPPTYADKKLLKLEEMYPFSVLGYKPMPSEVEIIGIRIAQQSPYEYPPTCLGNIWAAIVDPVYLALSGIETPGVEDCDPFGFVQLGKLPLRPGRDQAAFFDHATPILYRKGENLFFSGQEVQGANGFGFRITHSIITKGDDNRWPWDDGVIFVMPLNAEAGGGFFCTRNLVNASPAAGSKVQVHVSAGASGGTIASVRVGLQANGPNMIAASAAALCGGQTGLTLPANGGAWFEASLNVPAGAPILVQACISGHWAYKKVSPPSSPSWVVEGTDSGANANMQGMYGQYQHIYAVDCVQVMA